MNDKDEVIRIAREDERFFDLLSFALEKIELTPKAVALLVISEIICLEICKKTGEARFYFKTNPSIIQKRLAQSGQSSSHLH